MSFSVYQNGAEFLLFPTDGVGTMIVGMLTVLPACVYQPLAISE